MFKIPKYKFLRIFFFLFVILVLIDTSLAGSYGAGPYGSGKYGIGYIAPTTTSSGGGGRSYKTYTPVDLTKKNTYELFKKDKIEFSLDDKVHTIKVDYINKDYVDLEITSNPIKLRIYKGESKVIDVNNNNINDIKITLNNIKYSKISVSIELVIEDINGKIKDAKIIKEIEEEKIIEEEIEEEVVVEKPEIHSNKTIFSKLFKNSIWIIALIILVVVFLFIQLAKYLKLEKT